MSHRTTIRRKPVPIRKPKHHGPPGDDHSDEIAAGFLYKATTKSEVIRLEPQPRQDLIIDNHEPRGYRPFWLRKTVLSALSAVFFVVALILIVLYTFSARNRGLAAQESKYQYAWTYGPTMVLALFVMFWRQVDYSCKQLVPWQVLEHGPATPKTSLFLDYISPLHIESMVKAIRNHHWGVVISIGNFALLKVMIVLSTGLLSLKQTSISDTQIPLVATTKLVDTNFKLNSTSVSPVFTAFGIIAADLPYPNGTSNSTVAQSFQPLKSISQVLFISANVTAITVDLDCTIGTLSNFSFPENCVSGTNCAGLAFNGTFLSSNNFCNLTSVSLPLTSVSLETFYGDVQPVWCQSSEKSPDGRYGDQYLITLTHQNHTGQCNKEDLSYKDEKPPCHYKILASSAIICNPVYSYKLLQVTFYPKKVGTSSQLSIQEILTTVDVPMSSSPWELGEAVMGQLNASAELFGKSSYDILIPPLDNPDPLFKMMQAQLKSADFGPLLDPQILMESARTVYRSLATQLIDQSMVVPDATRFSGAALYSETRLHVERLPAYTMTIFAIILGVSSAFMCKLRPVAYLPCDPGSIKGIATVLSKSTSLKKQLEHGGHLKTRDLRKTLDGFKYQLVRSPSNLIPTVHIQRSGDGNDSPSERLNFHWWRPIMAQRYIVIAVLLLPTLMIISLEVIQRVSDRHSGFVETSPSDNRVVPFSKYIPTLMMLLVATMYGSLEFTMTIYAPYSKLTKGSAKGSQTILVHFLNSIPVLAVIKWVRTGHHVIIFASVAAFAASFLSIFTSGLYTVASAPDISTWSLNRLDNFNFTTGALQYRDDGGAGPIFSLIQYSNLSYPPWTYDELVFPKIWELPDQNDLDPRLKADGAATSVKMNLPALRASLNCTMAPPDLIGGQVSAYGYLLIEDSFRLDCVGREYSWNTSIETVVESATWDGPGTYVGSLQNRFSSDGSLGETEPCYSAYQCPQSTASRHIAFQNDCPTLWFQLGQYFLKSQSPSNNSSGDPTVNVTGQGNTMVCAQTLQEVQTDVIFILPGMTIDPSRPPVPDESSATYITSPSNSSQTGFQFLLAYFARTGWANATLPLNTSTTNIGHFFQALSYGKNGLPMEFLSDPAHGKEFQDAVQHLYRSYMAQMISLNFRTANIADGTIAYAAEVTTWNKQRLLQNRVPKTVLQILLALMTVLGAAVYVLMDTRKVLPHNPCTIAGSASLIAGSVWCNKKVMGEETEELSDEEWARMFDGWMFSMGWWTDQWEDGVGIVERRRFGIDVGRAEAAS